MNGVETWGVYGLGGELLAEYAANAAATAPQPDMRRDYKIHRRFQGE